MDEDLVHGGRPPSESVIVDIGGAIGALVVTTADDMNGAEIELCPVGAKARSHTIVRPREIPGGGVIYASVFPSLPQGDYTLLAFASRPETVVRIEGGSVTQFAW